VDTLERLKALLEKDFDIPPESLAPEARLEDLDIDSLRMIEIFFAVEEKFGVTASSDQAELRARIHTFGDLAGYIEELVAKQAPGATETS
jgi:acyl carrier protein